MRLCFPWGKILPKPLLFLKVCFYAAPIVLDYCGSSIIKGWTTPVYSIRYAILANLRDSVNLHARYESVSCVRQVVGCRWQVALVGLALGVDFSRVESSRVESLFHISWSWSVQCVCSSAHGCAHAFRSARLGSALRTHVALFDAHADCCPPARPPARPRQSSRVEWFEPPALYSYCTYSHLL